MRYDLCFKNITLAAVSQSGLQVARTKASPGDYDMNILPDTWIPSWKGAQSSFGPEAQECLRRHQSGEHWSSSPPA